MEVSACTSPQFEVLTEIPGRVSVGDGKGGFQVKVEVPEYTVQTEVEVDPKTTALIVVDMQNDFVKAGGRLVVPDAEKTIPAIRRLLDFAREHGLAVFFTQDTHGKDDPEFAIWGEHVVEGTWGWQIVEELAPREGERVIRKLCYDGFFGTSLDHELRLRNIKTVIVCGTVANICVHYTAASAALHGYQVILPIDAISALNEFDMQAAIRQASFLFRAIITTSEALRVRGPAGARG